MGFSSLFNKGTRLPRSKATEGMGIVPMALPKEVHIPMRQGRCDAAEPVVQPGDYVRMGQLIGRSVSSSSVPVHSSVSGTVTGLAMEPSQQGGEDIHVIIACDGRQELASTVRPPVINDTQGFIEAVRASGLIGLGGAGFPMAAKFAACLGTTVDTLIINGAECEPFITADHMTMMAHSRDVLDGASEIMKRMNIRSCIIAVSARDRDAAELFEGLVADMENFSVKRLPDLYPAGAEQLVVARLTGRRVLPGRIPQDVGCMVCNVNSVVKLWHYISTGLPLVTKNVTVDGSAVFSRRNVEIPIGTRIGDLLDFCGGSGETRLSLILLDGVMMGHSVPDVNYALTKLNNAVLFFDEDFAKSLEETACIRCGRCIDSCAMNLMPGRIADALSEGNTSLLRTMSPSACMRCGACSYVCPARRRLCDAVVSAAALLAKEGKGGTADEQ